MFTCWSQWPNCHNHCTMVHRSVPLWTKKETLYINWAILCYYNSHALLCNGKSSRVMCSVPCTDQYQLKIRKKYAIIIKVTCYTVCNGDTHAWAGKTRKRLICTLYFILSIYIFIVLSYKMKWCYLWGSFVHIVYYLTGVIFDINR